MQQYLGFTGIKIPFGYKTTISIFSSLGALKVLQPASSNTQRKFEKDIQDGQLYF